MESRAPKLFTKKRIICWGILLVLLLWNIVKLPQSHTRIIPLNDFVAYWSAAKVFLGGENPYDPSILMTIQREAGWTEARPLFTWNPPWALPIIMPFCLCSFWPARIMWLILNAVLTVSAADWFWRYYGGPVSHRWIGWTAAIFFIPSAQALLLGQTSPLVLTGFWGFLWAVKKNRPILAGMFTVLISLKPHLIYLFWIFLVLWVFKKKAWNILCGAIASLSAISLIAIKINPHIFAEYFSIVNSSYGPIFLKTPTWGVALISLFPENDWFRFIPSGLGIITAFLLWKKWGGMIDWQTRLPIILLLSVITASYAWTFDWIVLLPVVIIILCQFLNNPPARWWLPATLVIMQLMLIWGPPKSYFYSIWLPPILMLLFWAANTKIRYAFSKNKAGL